MPRKDKKKKEISIHLKDVTDGLGLCKLCEHLEFEGNGMSVDIGSTDYFKAHCKYANKPCAEIRRSLIHCVLFKQPQVEIQGNLLTRIWKWITANKWE
jgi:hypothetical protein